MKNNQQEQQREEASINYRNEAERYLHNKCGIHPNWIAKNLSLAMEEYANKFKSPAKDQEAKILQECKDEVAKGKGYSNWKGLMNDNALYGTNVEIYMSDVAELYANQFKSQATQEWIDIKDEIPNNGRDVLLGDIESGIVTTGFMSFEPKGFIPNCVMTVTHWRELPEAPIEQRKSKTTGITAYLY